MTRTPRPGRPVYRRLTVCLVLIAGGAAYSGSASAIVISPPTLTVYPFETTLAQFTQMDVWITGAGAGSQVVMALRGVAVASGATDSNGRYVSGDVPVPSGAAACGQNEVDWYSGGDFITSADVNVYCPTVQVTPSQIDHAGGAITVTGTGYPQYRDVVFILDDAQTGFDTVSTDGNGAFTRPTSLPALTCGTHRLTVTAEPPPTPEWEHAGSSSTVAAFPPLPASTTFMVTGCPTQPSPPPAAPRPAPKLVANPAVITEGTLTHVTGTGFPPSVPITLVWETAAGRLLSPCSPDADSAPPLTTGPGGTIDTYCLADPHQVVGAEQIAALPGAVDIAGLARTDAAHVAAPVVVEGGSMQPSSGDQFVFRR